MAAKHRYTIGFARASGCERGIAEDMARFDAGRIVAETTDDRCRDDNLRSVTIEGRFPPTMARWASFVVGARQE